MLRVRFQTMLVIMITAVVTILLFDILREKTLDFVSVQKVSDRTVAIPSGGATIKLPVLAVMSKSKVVSVPDGGVLVFGGGIMRRPKLLTTPPSDK